MFSSGETDAGAARGRRGPRSRSRAGGRGRVRGRRSGGARGGRGADPSRDARSGRGRGGGEVVIGGAGRGRRARAARTLGRKPGRERRVDLRPYHIWWRRCTRRRRRHRSSCCRARRRARTLLVLRRPASPDGDGDARGDRRSDDERDDRDDDTLLDRRAPPSRARDAHARAAASRQALRRVDGDDLRGLLLPKLPLLVGCVAAYAVQLDGLVRRLDRRRGRPDGGRGERSRRSTSCSGGAERLRASSRLCARAVDVWTKCVAAAVAEEAGGRSSWAGRGERGSRATLRSHREAWRRLGGVASHALPAELLLVKRPMQRTGATKQEAEKSSGIEQQRQAKRTRADEDRSRSRGGRCSAASGECAHRGASGACVERPDAAS